MLDDRKIKVLYAIINSHIMSAEPIGSRTISRDYDLGVSPATIRNEMSDLEEQGYLNKPHSSSGRVPSDKGYRLYVDEILKLKRPSIDLIKKDEIKKILSKESREIEELIQNSAKFLSALTNYTALAISPQAKQSKLKHIQLISINSKEVLLILVSESDIVKNSILRLERESSENEIAIISNYLSGELKGLTLNEIGKKIKLKGFIENPEFKSILDSVLPIIYQSLEDIDNIDLYSDGITNILNFPEYEDLEKAKSFISFIENKELVVDLMSNNSLEKDFEITIGNENIYTPIKDCSLITATYRVGDKTIGKIGLIGPTRMDYIKLMDILQMFSVNITEITNMYMGL